MAEIPAQVDSTISETMDAVAETDAAVPKYEKSYKIVGEARVPVSRKHGTLWKHRKEAALHGREELVTAWDEAIRYYLNDQSGHRDANGHGSGNMAFARRINAMHSETENIVFATVNATVPAIYAKNPTVEFTSSVDKANATMFEKLINRLAEMETAPGFHAKPKLKQAVVLASLTNCAWIEEGYTRKEESSELMFEEVRRISGELAEAKEEKEIERLEGELMAIEETFDVVRPEGLFLRLLNPKDVLVDPESCDPHVNDANWLMVRVFLPTEYVRAKFAQEKNGEERSIYKSSHVLRLDKKDADDLSSFKAIKDSTEYGDNGYSDQYAFDKSGRTECWYVWDKVTRRVLLYREEDWTWPLWVWDDPYGLPRFFPYRKLFFHMPPSGRDAKGEVTYYLDQQDAINEINDEFRRARQQVKRNVLFDKNSGLSREDVENVLKGDDGTARGVDIPEGKKMEDLFFSPTPKVMQFRDLFVIDSKLQAIDRITGMSEVMRGSQFKTNTTNQAIQYYSSVSGMRIDEKIDTMEDFIGGIYLDCVMLCAKFMSREMVSMIVGEEMSRGWANIEPRDFLMKFSMTTVGGSTTKPTSDNKKKEAVQVVQGLGQFASATPQALVFALRVIENAFENFHMSPEDWKVLRESVEKRMSGGRGDAPAAPPGGVPSQPAPTGGGAPPGVDLEAVMARLPPEVQEMVQQMVAQGVPPEEALRQLANGGQ